MKRIFQSKVEGESFRLTPNMSKVLQGDVLIIYAKNSVKWAEKEFVLASIKFFASCS